MVKKILIGVVVLVLAFLGYVISRPSRFMYSRSGVYQAKPEKIFPYLASFKKGNEWSPYMRVDPNMKVTYGGNDGEVGSTLDFDGNMEVGTGRLEITRIVPNELVEMKLTMIKPIAGESMIHYALEDDNGATKFTWSMEGESGFFGKLMSVLIDCEKMMTEQYDKGIANLRPLVEQI